MDPSVLQMFALTLKIVGLVAVVTVIVVATRQANRLGKNVLLWGIAAAAAFAVPSIFLRRIFHAVWDSFMFGGNRHSVAEYGAVFVSYHVLPLLAGLLACYVLRKQYNARNPEDGFAAANQLPESKTND
jgi:hypothetical protein